MDALKSFDVFGESEGSWNKSKLLKIMHVLLRKVYIVSQAIAVVGSFLSVSVKREKMNATVKWYRLVMNGGCSDGHQLFQSGLRKLLDHYR